MTSFSWKDLSLSDSTPLFLLGNPPQSGLVTATRVHVAKDALDALQSFANMAAERITSEDALPYSETELLSQGQHFIGSLKSILGLALDPVDEGSAGQKPESTGGGSTAQDEEPVSASLLEQIVKSRRSDERLTPADVAEGKYVFYVVVGKDTHGEDVAFIRKPQGVRVSTKNRFYMRQSDMLRKLEEPLFKVEERFDFAVRGDDVLIWHPDNFLHLFSDVEALNKAVPSFVGNIQKSLPLQLNGDAVEAITKVGKNGVRAAQQIRRVSRLAYLNSITATKLESYLAEIKEINHNISIVDSEIGVPESDVPSFLHLLEQRLWKGPFDGAVRQAQAFSKLS
ncbi:Kiwa anti-phage protein KwaB-like domain-containing protein [Brachybacterium sp. AOP42-C2-15]|uniref:Kiwa anti-phage protein KwaB-like domain-containing protein n=1 Tax=unclassified Brachybacterium TaxID=2623841 RepID=UPI004033444E